MRKIDELKSQMVSFKCHRTVKAVPMSKVEYAKLREFEAPEKDEPGWLAIHEDGYISWSPEEVFRKDYRLSEIFTDRLKIEMEDLEVKIQKLENFLYDNASEGLDTRLRGLLIVQLSAMQTYYSTMRTRFESLTQSEEN